MTQDDDGSSAIEKAQLHEAVQELVENSLRHREAGDEETIRRAGYYVTNRINEGHIRDVQEMKSVWAAFGDGFCTGRGHSHGQGESN